MSVEDVAISPETPAAVVTAGSGSCQGIVMAREISRSSETETRGEQRGAGPVSFGVKKLFLLSPAKVTGQRAKMLLNPEAQFALARTFHREGLALADVFTFASGLYFRGKITYARRFAKKSPGAAISLITANAGLVAPELHVGPTELAVFGGVDIHEDDPRYHGPLKRDARKLAAELTPDGRAILLGSIATAKYRDVLLECFGERLMFPADFVGRGDMSRGGLLLRAAASGEELDYIPVLGAITRGRRAPRISELVREKPKRSPKRT
jgi:hypothetical protein